jgi:hypothetical protein
MVGVFKSVSSKKILIFLLMAVTGTVSCTHLIEKTYSGPNNIELTKIDRPLMDDAFKAKLETPFPSVANLKTSTTAKLHLVVTNLSDHVWPAIGTADNVYRIRIGNHWLAEDGQQVVKDDGRCSLPFDLQPGSKAEVLLAIKAPAEPGKYTLEIDAVQEGVAWFAQKGSQPLRIDVTVER